MFRCRKFFVISGINKDFFAAFIIRKSKELVIVQIFKKSFCLGKSKIMWFGFELLN